MKEIFKDQAVLIYELKNGNDNAFEYLVDEYSQRLFAYAITLTNNQITAEDIIQNVFMRTWERRKKLDIRQSLQNYLYKSVHNEFINQYKKKRSTMLLEQKYFNALNKIVLTQEDILLKKKIELVTQEIQNLPPKCKEVFMLSRKEGLTNLEISGHLNISIKTVEGQMTKAFSFLRERLKEKVNTILFFNIGKIRF